MIPTKIFLDLDDVLNKFTMWALRHVGCPVSDDLDYSQYNRDWGYDIVKAANALHPKQLFTRNEFWNCFDQETWASVPPSNEFPLLLFASCAIVGVENVYVLTRPVPYPGCLEGKRQWIKRFLPAEMEENYFIGTDKFILGTHSPEHLLIDDVKNNVHLWQEAGGSAVLFPRPWNARFDVDPGKAIAATFSEIGFNMQKKRNHARR